MFRIVFIRDRIDWMDGHGERGFIFEPSKRKKKPFDFFGYKIWSPSWHIFISTDQNLFFILEVLLHEIVHVVIRAVFLRGEIAEKVNWWYDLTYWGVLRILKMD